MKYNHRVLKYNHKKNMAKLIKAIKEGKEQSSLKVGDIFTYQEVAQMVINAYKKTDEAAGA